MSLSSPILLSPSVAIPLQFSNPLDSPARRCMYVPQFSFVFLLAAPFPLLSPFSDACIRVLPPFSLDGCEPACVHACVRSTCVQARACARVRALVPHLPSLSLSRVADGKLRLQPSSARYDPPPNSQPLVSEVNEDGRG